MVHNNSTHKDLIKLEKTNSYQKLILLFLSRNSGAKASEIAGFIRRNGHPKFTGRNLSHYIKPMVIDGRVAMHGSTHHESYSIGNGKMVHNEPKNSGDVGAYQDMHRAILWFEKFFLTAAREKRLKTNKEEYNEYVGEIANILEKLKEGGDE